MAKTIKKKSMKKVKFSTPKKRDHGVFVHLARLHKKEYEFYSNSSQIIVKNFNIKINGDEMLIGEEKHRGKEGVFNLTLKKDENSDSKKSDINA